MRILYISDRRDGGILRHVKCLRKCLPPEVESFEIGLGGEEEFAGRSGHDLREFWQIRRVMRCFRPDIVHFHISNVLMAFYVRFFTSVPCVCTWHTPTNRKIKMGVRLFFSLLGRRAYYLPVSSFTWNGFKEWLPRAKGEVFFNPLRFKKPLPGYPSSQYRGSCPVVGMVGRNADQKDWPNFHKVEALVQKERPDVRFLNAGEEAPCNGREAIAKMDLFVMTSKHEQLPTTLLECFALGTPVCGFLPDGGVVDILAFSSGPVREAFISTRDCSELASVVLNLIDNYETRRALAEDGADILTKHFDAERLVPEQLVNIYRRLLQN